MTDYEVIYLIISGLSLAGTVGLVITACFALRTWRKEFIGKKKIELAAEITAAVYEFQDILTSAMLIHYTPAEINDIEKWLVDVNDKKSAIPGSVKWPIHRDRLNYLTPIHRLNANADKTENFAQIFNKGLMYWPEDLYKLLVELHSFLGQIRYASEMLYENPNVREYWDTAFVENPDNNKIFKRIFEIGDEIKLNLAPLYKDKQTPWKKLPKKEA
jgi:hypothetical protein